MRLRMGRERNGVLTLDHLPPEEAVAAYDPQNGFECCDPGTFKLDLRNTATSSWNQSAARVLTLDYIDCGKGSPSKQADIHRHIRQHINYLHSKFKKDSASLEAQEVQRRISARKQRKIRVSIS